MVLPGYMLAGYHKTDGYTTEGAIKYFLLGSFSSAIFLFGLVVRLGPHRDDPRRRGRREAHRDLSRHGGRCRPAWAWASRC